MQQTSKIIIHGKQSSSSLGLSAYVQPVKSDSHSSGLACLVSCQFVLVSQCPLLYHLVASFFVYYAMLHVHNTYIVHCTVCCNAAGLNIPLLTSSFPHPTFVIIQKVGLNLTIFWSHRHAEANWKLRKHHDMTWRAMFFNIINVITIHSITWSHVI